VLSGLWLGISTPRRESTELVDLCLQWGLHPVAESSAGIGSLSRGATPRPGRDAEYRLAAGDLGMEERRSFPADWLLEGGLLTARGSADERRSSVTVMVNGEVSELFLADRKPNLVAASPRERGPVAGSRSAIPRRRFLHRSAEDAPMLADPHPRPVWSLGAGDLGVPSFRG
jgi:hypothetical protein